MKLQIVALKNTTICNERHGDGDTERRRGRASTLTAIHICHRRHIPITDHTVRVAGAWYVRSCKSWAGPVRCFTQTSTSTSVHVIWIRATPCASPNSSLQSSSIRRGKHRPHHVHHQQRCCDEKPRHQSARTTTTCSGLATSCRSFDECHFVETYQSIGGRLDRDASTVVSARHVR